MVDCTTIMSKTPPFQRASMSRSSYFVTKETARDFSFFFFFGVVPCLAGSTEGGDIQGTLSRSFASSAACVLQQHNQSPTVGMSRSDSND